MLNEEYFHKAGRAGRDGLPSRAHMFSLILVKIPVASYESICEIFDGPYIGLQINHTCTG